MRSKALGVLLVVAFLVSACGPVYETRYQFTPPTTPQGQLCVNQCQQINLLCRRNCQLESDSCLAREYEQARWRYEDYVRERRAANQPIERSPDDFVYRYNCPSSNSCTPACDNDHRVCYQTCGGQVSATTVCTANCS